MSALPDEQPLTRRQMRESERSRQPEAASVDPADPSNAEQPAAAAQPPVADPAAQAAAERQRAEADAAAWAPKSAQAPAAPASVESDDAEPEADDNDFGDFQGVPERTLTRRELRALLAAQAAARGEQLDESPESSAGDAHTSDAVAPQPPIGHWSLDIDVEDDADDQSFDQVLSRGVGAGGVPTTTNALILPMIPQQGDGSGAPIVTGEMLVTGSIDLPSLGDTGAHPNLLDSPDVDRLLDQVDDAHPATSAQPVRASRAVSTHTSTRDTLTPPKQGGLNVPTVLAITAAVLALGVIGLFIGGYIFKIF